MQRKRPVKPKKISRPNHIIHSHISKPLLTSIPIKRSELKMNSSLIEDDNDEKEKKKRLTRAINSIQRRARRAVKSQNLSDEDLNKILEEVRYGKKN